MIKKNETYHLSENVTVCEFGYGDIIVADGYGEDGDSKGYLLLANDQIAKDIGTLHPDRDHRSTEEIKHDVIFIFSNVESLDVVIGALQRTKEKMLSHLNQQA